MTRTIMISALAVSLLSCKLRSPVSGLRSGESWSEIDADLQRLGAQLPLNEKTAQELEDVFFEAQKLGQATKPRIIKIGELFAYGAFSPEVTSYDGNNRDNFEWIRSKATPEQQEWLSKGLKIELDRAISKSKQHSPVNSVDLLAEAFPLWAEMKPDAKPDFLFKDFPASFFLANNYLRSLFLLKVASSDHVGKKAKAISEAFVRCWLEGAGQCTQAATEKDPLEYTKNVLRSLGDQDTIDKMEAAATRSPNIQNGPTITTAAMIYTQQYRNLVLKEILKRSNDPKFQAALTSNEAALTYMLNHYDQGEFETGDGERISALNLYALASSVAVAADAGAALDAMNKAAKLGPPRYYVLSDNPASDRAAAARWCVAVLARLSHSAPQDRQNLLNELDKAVSAYERYLPDLMFNARGSGMHRGSDQLAPYFFHPTLPFLVTALKILKHDPAFTGKRGQYKQFEDYLIRAVLTTQRENGTFLSPDIGVVSETDVGYYAAASWVNPLTGLALLTLMEQ